MNTRLRSLTVALAGLGMAVVHNGSALAGSTAQSAMIDTSNTSSSFVITQSETWAWDLTVAKTYYSNAYTGMYTVDGCTGGGNTGCTAQPSAPAAPEPKKNAENPVANGEQCVFFDGGTLTGGDTYTLKASAPDGKKGIWTFTYYYAVSPIATKQDVAARTAWTLTDSSSGATTVPVAINATLAGESALQNTANGKKTWNRKYSFTLLESDGTARISNLAVTLDGTDANGNAVSWGPVPAGYALYANLVYPTDDFAYVGNAGENGTATLLAARPVDENNPPPAMVGDILDGVVPGHDGVADDFANNNSNVGYTATVHKAVMDPVTFDLGPGCYTATISADMKGVSGSAALALSGSQNVSISAGSCGSTASIPGCPTP